jgi:hypothetical protein
MMKHAKSGIKTCPLPFKGRAGVGMGRYGSLSGISVPHPPSNSPLEGGREELAEVSARQLNVMANQDIVSR